MPPENRAMTAIDPSYRFALALAAVAAFVSVPGPNGAPHAQQGISVDQYRRMFPPAPVNVRVELRQGVATISWDRPPPPPAGRIGYDPKVAAYNVYRVNDNAERRLLGRTSAMTFKDRAALKSGEVRYYAVTAVQRSGVESGMSERAELRVPTAKK
jgi:fibronectin type 3 domain-containing protein